MKKAELRRINTKTRNAEAVKGTQAVEAPHEPRAGRSIVDKPPVAENPSRVEAPDPEVPEKAERSRFSARTSARFSPRPMTAAVRGRSVRCCAGRGCIPRI